MQLLDVLYVDIRYRVSRKYMMIHLSWILGTYIFMLQNICGLSEFRFKEAFIIFFFLLLLSLATFLSLVVV